VKNRVLPIFGNRFYTRCEERRRKENATRRRRDQLATGGAVKL
jgi:hypothetical protein